MLDILPVPNKVRGFYGAAKLSRCRSTKHRLVAMDRGIMAVEELHTLQGVPGHKEEAYVYGATFWAGMPNCCPLLAAWLISPRK